MVGSAFVGLSISSETDSGENQPGVKEVRAAPESTTSDSRTVDNVAQPLVKYTNLELGDFLFTRGCNSENRVFWVNRFRVTTIDAKGVAWGTFEQAKVRSADFRSLNYQSLDGPVNLSKNCVSGGCYTKETSASSDVKRWLLNGCPFKPS